MGLEQYPPSRTLATLLRRQGMGNSLTTSSNGRPYISSMV